MSRSRTTSTICCAHRAARAGPSKVAKKPSPAVSSSVPSNACSLATNSLVMALQQLPPARISEPGGDLRRIDDVRKQDGTQDRVAGVRRRREANELADGIDQRVQVTFEARAFRARQDDQLGARDQAGDVLRFPSPAFELPRETKRWQADRLDYLPDVRLVPPA